MSPGTIGELLRDGARRAGDRVAVREPGRPDVCYRELERDARRRASGLLARGLRPGDRVAAWLDDGRDYVELYLACALAGLIIVPCNRRYRAREVAAIVAACEPAILVHEPEAGDDLDVAAPGVPRLPRAGFSELAAAGALPTVRPEDPFVLGYTSGTTGPPKGAVLTHRSVCAIARLNADSYRLPEHSVCVMTGSMSFVAVVPAHVFSHFHVRGTVRFLGPWTMGSLIDVLATEHVDFVYVPSPLIEEFAATASARPAALDGLGTVLHSGSKASVASLTLLAGCVGTRLVEGWGMTENSGGLMTALRPEDLADRAQWPTTLSTVGRAATETEVDVVDESWRSLSHDGTTIGDLVFRSPAAMAGYWRDEGATERALRDGWVRSGDLGTIDESGYVRISDRRTDLIVSGGMNVYPFEVEECIRELPGVDAVTAVGVPHPKWGQTVVVAIQLGPGGMLTEGEVLDHCRTTLAPYKKPTAVVFVHELPRTVSLKVPRAQVRAALAAKLAARPGAAGPGATL